MEWLHHGSKSRAHNYKPQTDTNPQLSSGWQAVSAVRAPSLTGKPVWSRPSHCRQADTGPAEGTSRLWQPQPPPVRSHLLIYWGAALSRRSAMRPKDPRTRVWRLTGAQLGDARETLWDRHTG